MIPPFTSSGRWTWLSWCPWRILPMVEECRSGGWSQTWRKRNLMIFGQPIIYIHISKRTPTYPWSIPQASPNPQMKGIPSWTVGSGYVPGVCWKILRVYHPLGFKQRPFGRCWYDFFGGRTQSSELYFFNIIYKSLYIPSCFGWRIAWCKKETFGRSILESYCEFTWGDVGLQPPAILASLPHFPCPHVSSAIRAGMRKSCHQCKRILSDSNTLQGGQEGVPRCFFLHCEGHRSGRRWSHLWGSSKSRSTRSCCQFSKCFGGGRRHDDPKNRPFDGRFSSR